ncbi:MAG: hypothetical protein HYU97_11185 [Deltaproteobacteria bacterium]|nr:hypothetical protein [Deltaproteobacteria bacterium]
MNQLTLRQIPKAVQTNLKILTKHTGKSLNKTVIGLLEKALGTEAGSSKKRDLSALAGTWNHKEANQFLKNTQSFEAIDEEIWK